MSSFSLLSLSPLIFRHEWRVCAATLTKALELHRCMFKRWFDDRRVSNPFGTYCWQLLIALVARWYREQLVLGVQLQALAKEGLLESGVHAAFLIGASIVMSQAWPWPCTFAPQCNKIVQVHLCTTITKLCCIVVSAWTWCPARNRSANVVMFSSTCADQRWNMMLSTP